MMHRGWIGQPLLAKRKLLPMHLPPARDGPEHETRKARRAEQFADKPLFREAFARPSRGRGNVERLGPSDGSERIGGERSEAESRPRDTATVREIQER
jgi:hypothetical protein